MQRLGFGVNTRGLLSSKEGCVSWRSSAGQHYNWQLAGFQWKIERNWARDQTRMKHGQSRQERTFGDLRTAFDLWYIRGQKIDVPFSHFRRPSRAVLGYA